MTAPEQMLKPCPFCGGVADVTSYHSCDCCGKAWNGRVSCSSCHAERSHFDTDAEAIAAWNTRPAPAELVEALKGVLPYVEAERLAEEAAIRLGAQRAPIRQAVAKARAALRNAGAAS